MKLKQRAFGTIDGCTDVPLRISRIGDLLEILTR
jgi:hypothetical protein